MGKALVIVESPAKARTISGMLGPDFIVESSVGHIRDLPRGADEVPAAYKGESWARLGVDVDNGFKPLYVVSSPKKSVVANLKKLLKRADELYLATDEDREGESIAWHLSEVLVPTVPVKRMVFHEITPAAIARAVDEWRDLDRRLVDAQEARRILDRLYGYEVSPVLWRKVMPRLSAGRVQSVATRMVVERERARMRFRSATWWGIDGTFSRRGRRQRLRRRPGRARRDDRRHGQGLRRAGRAERQERGAGPGRGGGHLGRRGPDRAVLHREVGDGAPLPPLAGGAVHDVDAAAGGGPQAPLQRAAGHAGGPAPLRAGLHHLHAHRLDDAVRRGAERGRGPRPASSTATPTCPDAPRRYERKVKNAQEAHEAIRPSGETFRTPEQVGRQLSGDELRLYEMIWMRTVASQMNDATGTSAQVRLVADVPSGVAAGQEAEFSASGRVISFTGFLEVYEEGRDDDEPDAESAEERVLPALAEGDRVQGTAFEPGSHTTQPPARYTEASLVKAMEELGVGRPSTYASVIATILDRGYVWKKGTALVPSFTAFAVVGLLERYFANLVDYGFTASMEDDLDEIATGTGEALPWLTRFYFGSDAPGAMASDGTEVDTLGLKATVAAHLAEIDAREINSIPSVRAPTGSRSWRGSGATGPTCNAARTAPPSPTTWPPTS